MRSIYNEYLGHRFELPDHPMRVVSLVSSATEAMDKMGLLDRIVGVSEYCDRYVDTSNAEVVGQYVTANFERIKALQPDLILLTTGIQRKLSQRFSLEGLPIYNLNLPSSFHGVLENIALLGGLLNALDKSRVLTTSLSKSFSDVSSKQQFLVRPRVYVELWLGRHRRAVGGLSYIRDLVELAGGELVYGDKSVGYFENDLENLPEENPDLYVFFHEPEYLVDGASLVRERSWDETVPVVMSTVKMGENMIQDGPSMIDSAQWLHGKMKEAFS